MTELSIRVSVSGTTVTTTEVLVVGIQLNPPHLTRSLLMRHGAAQPHTPAFIHTLGLHCGCGHNTKYTKYTKYTNYTKYTKYTKLHKIHKIHRPFPNSTKNKQPTDSY